ncbi:MAG: hypothetical protein OXG43_12655 [Chloroflexi bacterium]|nr:hypothetical protein [Chloroflexota bacterium]
MTGIAVRRVLEWTARVLLLGVVAFWWGGYAATHLFSLAFPELLPPWDPTLGRLDADNEGTIANSVSAAGLACVTALALAAAAVSFRRSAGWIAVAGWAALTLTAAALTFEELAEFKDRGPISLFDQAGRTGLPWPVLVSPLVAVFVLAMWFFVRKGLSVRAARAPLTLGIACWVFVLVQEAIGRWMPTGGAVALGYVLEETAEFSGTLLIGLSAVGVLRNGRPPPYPLFGGRWRRSLVGSIAALAILGSLALAFLFRAPLIEAPAPYTRSGAFEVTLGRQEALVQEFRMPATPVQSLELLLFNCEWDGHGGAITVRVAPLDTLDRTLAEGSIEVPVGDCPRWKMIELQPPLTAAEGQPLAAQVAADVAPGAELGVGLTNGNRYEDGRLWINGELAWPDQNLEFVAYSTPEATLSKLAAIGRLLTTDPRWWLLVADAAVALTAIALIPLVLVESVRPGPPGFGLFAARRMGRQPPE